MPLSAASHEFSDLESASRSTEPTEEEKMSLGTKKIEQVSTQPSTEEEGSEPVMTLPPFPEGGWRAWSTVFGAFLVQYTCFGYVNSFGVFQDYYVRHYLTSYSPSDIGWIGGIQIFLTFTCGAVTGSIFDKGHLYLILTTLVLNSLALFTLSVTQQNAYYQVFLSQGVTLGLATGVSYVASLGIAGHYFHKRRPLAVGIISSGSALGDASFWIGSVINPIMLNRFFNGHIGFHNGVRISAGINTFLLIIAVLLMRTRLPPKGAQRFPIAEWFREPTYVSVLASAFFIFFGLFYPIFNIQLNAVTHGVDERLAFYSTSILNAASLFGRIVPGLFAPLVGTLNIGTAMTIGAGIVVFCMLAVKDAAGTIVFAIFYGFFSGGVVALTPAVVAHLSKSPAEIGTRMGIFFAVGGFVGLFATPISGALLTKSYVWVRPDIFAGVMIIVSGVGYGIARFFYGRGKVSFWL